MNDGQSEREPFWIRLLLRALRPPAADDREPIWAVSRKWLPFFIGLISVMTFGWVWFIAGIVIESGEYGDTAEIAVAIVDRASSATPLIALIGVCITYWLDILGGLLVVTARYLSSKFVTPLVERYRSEGKEEGRSEGKEEGKEEGRSEMHSAWLVWYRKSEEAKAKGLPFDEPPPELPAGLDRNGLEAEDMR